jgi:hypothetical protein
MHGCGPGSKDHGLPCAAGTSTATSTSPASSTAKGLFIANHPLYAAAEHRTARFGGGAHARAARTADDGSSASTDPARASCRRSWKGIDRLAALLTKRFVVDLRLVGESRLGGRPVSTLTGGSVGREWETGLGRRSGCGLGRTAVRATGKRGALRDCPVRTKCRGFGPRESSSGSELCTQRSLSSP